MSKRMTDVAKELKVHHGIMSDSDSSVREKKSSLVTLDTVLIPAINMSVESLHLASNDIAPIGGTTWVHNLKENGQGKSSPIDRIKNVLVKRDKEK
jgi:hypothetical protein